MSDNSTTTLTTTDDLGKALWDLGTDLQHLSRALMGESDDLALLPERYLERIHQARSRLIECQEAACGRRWRGDEPDNGH